jgi:hypothetical protein
MARGENASQEAKHVEPGRGTPGYARPSDRRRGDTGVLLGRLPGMHPATPRRNVVVALLYLYLFVGLLWASAAAAVTLPTAGAVLAAGCPGRRGR